MFRLAKSAAYSGGGWEHDEAAPEKREVESNSSWELDLEQEWGRKEFRYLERKETESEMDGDWAGGGGEQREKTISSHKHFVFRFECYSRNLEYVFLAGESLDSWFVLEGDEIHTSLCNKFRELSLSRAIIERQNRRDI